MKPIKLIALASAVGLVTLAGLMLFKKPRVEIREVKVAAPVVQPMTKMTDILVAANDIPMGKVLQAKDMKWQKWPDDALSPHYISQKVDAKANETHQGAVARSSFINGEPIRPQKLVKAGSKSFMATMVSQGMRAVSTPVTAETGAGGFILPNDKVDVILVRRLETDIKTRSKDELPQEAKTILTNVRVLGVDAVIEEKNGEKNVTARTVTLELSPEQAEVLALGKQLGTLSLALRSAVDGVPDKIIGEDGEEKPSENNPFKKKGDTSKINIVKFGTSSSATTNGQ